MKNEMTMPLPAEPGMMGDGRKEQSLNQDGSLDSRVAQDDVDSASGSGGRKEP